MKKKIFLMLAMIAVVACMLALAVSAESVHAGKVDLDATVTLSDGTVVNLFDSEGNALIWYENKDGELKSIRADIGIDGENKVDFQINNWVGWVSGKEANQFDKIIITVDGVEYGSGDIVVFSIMDDDVVITSSKKGRVGKAVNCYENAFKDAKKLEYAFLRLDTLAFYKDSFRGASNLKYVNFEDLAELVDITANSFQDCTSLGPTLVLPMSVKNIGTATFRNCTSLETVVLSDKVSSLGSYDAFMDCKKLTTIVIPGTLTNVPINSFKNSTAITKVCYVGTKEQAEAFIASAASSGGNPVIAELTIISYADYEKLADKSGKYFIYDYNYCAAFNGGNHTMAGNAVMQAVDYFKDITFADTCTVCNGTFVDASLTINPLFTWKGFSVSEQADANGCYSVTQGFYVDMEAIKAYAAIKTDFAFGVVASVGKENPISIVDGEVVADSNVIFAPISKNANGELSVVHNYFDIKVTGIDENNLSTQIAFNGYVVDGGEIYYLHGESTSETAVGSSYNDVK